MFSIAPCTITSPHASVGPGFHANKPAALSVVSFRPPLVRGLNFAIRFDQLAMEEIADSSDVVTGNRSLASSAGVGSLPQ